MNFVKWTKLTSYVRFDVLTKVFTKISGVPRKFFGGWVSSTNSVEDSGQKEQGSGGSSPLARGSTQFANEWSPYSDYGNSAQPCQNFGLSGGVWTHQTSLGTPLTKIHIFCEMTACHSVNWLQNWRFHKKFSGDSSFQTHQSYITVRKFIHRPLLADHKPLQMFCWNSTLMRGFSIVYT
jgi:hypothetical protein